MSPRLEWRNYSGGKIVREEKDRGKKRNWHRHTALPGEWLGGFKLDIPH